MNVVDPSRIRLVLGLPIAMTLLAEAFYLVVWGVVLFPQGSPMAKFVWTATCGVAMGTVIGVATLLWVEGRHVGRAAFWRAAAVVMIVGSYCAWLCSRIDIRLEYFGGGENTLLFVSSGVIPAIGGGLLYGWILYGGRTPFGAQRA